MTYSNTLKCVVSEKGNPRKQDKCLENVLALLNSNGIKTLGSCCGHGKYPCTIIIESANVAFELFSGAIIPRKKRFYRKDKQGYFYIPEVNGGLAFLPALKSRVSSKRIL